MADARHDGDDDVRGALPPDLGHVLGHSVHGGVFADCHEVALVKLQQRKQLILIFKFLEIMKMYLAA